MHTAPLVALVVVALSTVLFVVAVATVLGQRIRRAFDEAGRALERGADAAQRLTAVTEVTERELDALGHRMDGLRAARRAGRPHRDQRRIR